MPAMRLSRISLTNSVARLPSGWRKRADGEAFSAVVGLVARIGGLNDDAHGFLVETFESAPALQVLEMAANGSFADKLVALFLVDQTFAQETLGSRGSHRPAFSPGKRL